MSNTLVLQSHTQPLPAQWIQTCLDSVRKWADSNQYDYKFYDDELFEFIDYDLLKKLATQPIIATDLARLKLLQYYLQKSYTTVIWCDADFLVFSPKKFELIPHKYALGREVWIQHKSQSEKTLTSKVKVHNAFMMFRQNNSFLDFYTETAERLLMLNTGAMPPQFIGPKLLTALHNIVQCPIAEHAGMLGPLVIKDICQQTGPALDLFLEKSKQPIYAANLCSSLYSQGEISVEQIEMCISLLQDSELNILNH